MGRMPVAGNGPNRRCTLPARRLGVVSGLLLVFGCTSTNPVPHESLVQVADHGPCACSHWTEPIPAPALQPSPGAARADRMMAAKKTSVSPYLPVQHEEKAASPKTPRATEDFLADRLPIDL